MFKKRGSLSKTTGFFGRHRVAVASATLMGTIVGAGVLGIPYVVAKTGFFYGLVLIILLGLAFLFINLFVGEIVLRTRQQHQLTGYAERYLGTWGKQIIGLALFFGIYGALTAYLIGEGATLYSIFKMGTPLLYSIIFFIVASFIVMRGIKATGNAELILISLLFLVIILIGIFSFDNLNAGYLLTHDITKIFVPYGVILFAFIGFAAVPEMQEELGREKKKMKSAIIIGSIIPIILYIVFVLIVIGLVGLDHFELLQPNEKIATIALSIYSQPWLGVFANLLAVLAMFTSFLALGTALLEIYEYDYHLHRNWALLLTFSVPLIVILFNLATFITLLGLVGAVTGGIAGIIIVLMHWKAKSLGNRTPEFSLGKNAFFGMVLIRMVLIIMFVLGIIHELWQLL